MSAIDNRDAVRAGLGAVEELVQYAELPGGEMTHRVLSLLFGLGRSALDAHDTAEGAEEALRVALEGYAQARAREKFG